ncbi:MAG: pilus assembly protein [Oligoflexia bacterium]|nr:pilus assembly protein [Oligoflexia bacterium]
MLNKKLRSKKESGQAMIEFMMLIPILMAFIWYLVHVSSAINMSIVGQKHARSQLFLRLFNHRSGPMTEDFRNTKRSHYYIGVSSKVTTVSNELPEAPIETLGIGPTPKPMDIAVDDPGEAEGGTYRQKVRVRTVVGICTHRKLNPSGIGLTDYCGSESTGGGGP